ncbi:MAG: cation diffusion facilitator family transporter, partial [Brachymonas sp.]|nr:cation diffusion facilitator family transporter [Brachymonas sp.]
LSDGVESFVNLAGAVFALIMVTVAERPADVEHPHGHHKAEYFASAFEGFLIFAAALAIIWTAVQRLMHPQPLEQLGWGMALSMLSTAINGVMAWVLLKGAKAHKSIALEADGKHLRTDVYTSFGVIAGIGLVTVTGWQWLDPAVAILVALNILYEGWGLVHASSHGLLDHSASAETNQTIQRILQNFQKPDAPNQPPVHFDHVVTRAAGQRNFVSMHLHLPAQWTLGEAAELRNQVEKALLAELPTLHATIELMPRNVEPVEVLLNKPLYGTTDAAGQGTEMPV